MIKNTAKLSLNKFLGINENADCVNGFSGEAVNMKNFSITENHKLKKRNGYSYIISHTDKPIYAMWYGEFNSGWLFLYVAGDRLYKYSFATTISTDLGYIGAGRAKIFSFGSYIYILNSINYYRYNGSSLAAVDGYVPTVLINSSPNGSGTNYEAVNILTVR
ncbi:MAG: hypothetical protein A2Y17_08055 [Clostridiales bacterium GWF2_38_85]|nr:MAG: hypothetical protein A2Y17_08055 [Clostridiales bacterium GWF2_38_85]HBL83855.1 hypothetical protein [Clostridiales bacterium]